MNIKNSNFTAIVLMLLLFGVGSVVAQEQRASPPATASAKVNGADIAINYSQPSAKGRTIMGGLVPYGQVWRTGANEATTFETSKDVKIQGQSLKAGKYALFTIPGEKKWKVIFNSNPKQWGAYKYDSSLDVLTVEVDAKAADQTETFTIEASNNGAITMKWEKTSVTFNVE